jgi:predicted regulator of Ras-like GTPase activity (Roadblock/LC7/MglB family)
MIVGNDGVLLETNNQAFRTEAEGLAAMYASFFRASLKTARDTDMGPLQSLQLATDRGKILLRALTGEYFLMLFLETESLAGKAFFEISRASVRLEKELLC